jgi:hypothetical protein
MTGLLAARAEEAWGLVGETPGQNRLGNCDALGDGVTTDAEKTDLCAPLGESGVAVHTRSGYSIPAGFPRFGLPHCQRLI